MGPPSVPMLAHTQSSQTSQVRAACVSAQRSYKEGHFPAFPHVPGTL